MSVKWFESCRCAAHGGLYNPLDTVTAGDLVGELEITETTDKTDSTGYEPMKLLMADATDECQDG